MEKEARRNKFRFVRWMEKVKKEEEEQEKKNLDFDDLIISLRWTLIGNLELIWK